jgi:hypothetical protein
MAAILRLRLYAELQPARSGCLTLLLESDKILHMGILATSSVLYLCFWIGLALVFVGTAVGVILSFKKPVSTPATAKAKIKAAKAKVQDLAKEAVEAEQPPAPEAAEAAAPVESNAADADTLLKDAESLVDSLPEPLRFAGFVIVFGALLMSVAAVQIGGHSIF